MRFGSLIATLVVLFIPALVSAIPADPRPRMLRNPDGSLVKVRVFGDEKFHFMTDAEGRYILHRDEKGFLVKSTRGGAPLAFSKETVDMLREERGASPFDFKAPERNPSTRMASLDADGRSNYPTVGNETRSLVVLVEFEDVKFTVENPQDYFTRKLNEPGFSDYGGKGSALDYYKAASHGLYTPAFDVYGPVKIDKPASYFEHTDDEATSHMDYIIRQALTQLHSSGQLKLSDYDFDNDGILDTVFIYYAGYGSADSDTPTIWPHQYDYDGFVYYDNIDPLIIDDIRVGPYACANELNGWNPQTGKQPWQDGSEPWVSGIGTFVHEYGHVLGLPDLYDVEYGEGVVTPGDWDVMCSGSYNFNGCVPPLFSAYEQWVCRWLEYTDAQDATHYDLAALGHTDNPSAVRIRIPTSRGVIKFEPEYFVIESRGNSDWDACFPKPGLMVWRINYSRALWDQNLVNSADGSNVSIVYADGESDPLFSEGSLVPGGAVELVPTSDYPGWESPYITNISYSAEQFVGSFDYNMLTDAPEIEVILSDTPYADEDSSNNFTLQWTCHDDVDSYRLTVRRADTGRPFGVYEEFDVGKTTSHKVISVTPAFWNNEIEAYVRAVKGGIPSSMRSNIVTFCPKDLPKGAGTQSDYVDSIGQDDVKIYGSFGCVVAPQEAIIRNLAGQVVANSDLPGGVYIVTCGSTSVKVIVK